MRVGSVSDSSERLCRSEEGLYMDNTMDDTDNIVGEVVHTDNIPLEEEVVVDRPLSHSMGAAVAVEVADFDRVPNFLEGESAVGFVQERVPVAAASIVVEKGVVFLAFVFVSFAIERRRVIRVSK